MEEAYIGTPLGTALLRGNEEGLSRVHILNETPALTRVVPPVLEDAWHQLREYFEGSRKVFDLKLSPEGTAFQKRVWEGIRTVPYGTTLSYLKLAVQLGDPKAIRAVAAANGSNPLWIITPCHRIIGTDGSLTGYAGGLHRKKWLLDHESPYKQLPLF